MESLDAIKRKIEAAVPGARVEIVKNESPSGQHSLLLFSKDAFLVAQFLKADPSLKLDYASNVTGIDWPELVIKEKLKTKKVVEGVEKEVEEVSERVRAGYLEAVYHLYSVELKHGPLILRIRTENRSDKVSLPSLTPIWRGCEFQEREIYDLYGITFTGHPDLRRILMWDGYADHPMRRDYVEPDDYEYEPTPHDEVLQKTQQRHPSLKSS